MNRDYMSSPANVIYMLGGFAIGMLTMYLLDPVQGNRRRALIKDKAYSAALTARKQADAKSRHLANRARGLAYTVRHTVEQAKEMPSRVAEARGPHGPA